MATLNDRLRKLESSLSPDYREPDISLEQITDSDLETLAALTEKQMQRVCSHPDAAVMLISNAVTSEDGARLAEIAREIISVVDRRCP